MENGKNDINQISRRNFIGKVATVSAFMIVPRYVLGRGFVAPSDKINLGFIGAGKRADKLQREFINLRGVHISKVCDVYKAKANNFVRMANAFYSEKTGYNYSGCHKADNYKDILENKDIDAVVIATPDHWHAFQAVHAAEAGKDIFCEKPLSLTIKEGRAMVNATGKNDRIFQTGNMQRSYPEFRHAVELIRNGYIGQIKSIQVNVGGPPVPYNLPKEPIVEGLDWDTWLGPNLYQYFNNQLNPPLGDPMWARWRDFEEFGGGDMTDWGAHMFDIAQWALNMDHSGPKKIIPPDGKDYPFLTYLYDNGVKMTHEDFGKKHAIQFIGSEGKIQIQRGNLVTYPENLKDIKLSVNEERVYHSNNHFEDFINAIKTRKQPISGVEIGHRTATVCNLGNIAYKLKRPLVWNPKKEKFKKDKEANELCTRSMRKDCSI